jgi:hypothetical protein
MRHRPIQAAPRERVPFTLWGPKRIRTALAAATAAAVGLVPVVFIGSPALAAPADYLTITNAANYEGGNLIFKLTYTGTTTESFAITTGATAASDDVDATGAALLDSTTGNKDFDNDYFTTPVVLPAASTTNPATAYIIIPTKNDDDTVAEAFTLTATGTGPSTKTATGTITAAPESPGGGVPAPIPTVSLSAPASVSESAGTATVVASLSRIMDNDVTFAVTAGTPGGTADATLYAAATGGVTRDYTALGSEASITIPAGQISGSLNIAINDDVVDEPDTQYIGVRLTGLPAGITATNSYSDVGIADNDAAPTVSLGDIPAVAESAPVSVPVKLSGLSEKPLRVNLSTANGTDGEKSRGASGGDGVLTGDFRTETNRQVDFAALTQTVYHSIPVRDDTAIEGTETFTVSLSASTSNPVALGTPTTGTATINDNETLPDFDVADMDVDVTAVDAFFDEGSTSTTNKEIEVRITLDPLVARETPLKLNYAFTDGTATNGVDYKGTAGVITVPTDAVNGGLGYWVGKVPVTIVGDTSYEGVVWNLAGQPAKRSETFNVVFTSSNSSILAADLGTQVVHIAEGDDDKQATWTTSDVAIAEGNEGATMAKVPIALSTAVGADTVFTPVFSRTPGSATETGVNAGVTVGENDYDIPAAKSVTIKAGQTNAVLEIPINGDAIYERDEALVVDFDVTGGAVDTALTADVQHSSRVTITNDDAKPTLKINEIAGAEGTTVRVSGTLVGVSQYGYSLGVTVAGNGDNAATAGKDFEVPADLATKVINITRGQTALTDSKITEFYLLPDDIDEPTETFGVTVAETSAAPQGFTSVTGNFRITDDPADLPPAASVQDESIGEWEQTVDVDVTFAFDENTKETTQTVTIPWQTSDGSAKQGEDYQFTKGVITLKPGDLTAKVNIPVINDKMKENEENFYVKLLSASPTGAMIARGAGEVIIKSDDKADAVTPTLSVKGPSKGVGLATFSGTAAPNTTVELWGAPLPTTDPKEFKYLSETDADDDGYFELSSKSLASGWAFVARSQEINSAVKIVKVTQLPSFSASSPKKGKLSVSVAGNPRAAGQAVTVQRWSGGKWSTVGKGTTTATGWKGTFSYKSKTKLTLRAMVGGSASAGINSGYSGNKTVTIK